MKIYRDFYISCFSFTSCLLIFHISFNHISANFAHKKGMSL